MAVVDNNIRPKQIGNIRIFGWYNLFWLEIIKDAHLGQLTTKYLIR